MKYVLALVGIVLLVALAGSVLSQNKRLDCLQSCRDLGDACAAKALRAHAACIGDPVVCEGIKKKGLRQCAVLYDACRYECDLPRF
jgi:hypothetical protein